MKTKDLDETRWIELAQYIYKEDPAATSWQEVYELYPGIRALRDHALAHALYLEGEQFEARRLSEKSKRETGIEIHPGAEIGDNLFIDHGMGIVIGETAQIGDQVKIYHGVTLGGTGKEKGRKRHPTIKDYVEIGTGATILGNVTIGHHSKVGAGAVVLEDVPPYATAVGVPARIILHDKNWNRIGEYEI